MEQNLNPADIASKFVNSTGSHIFLTGKAGTGKTTFLKRIREQTHKKTVVTAPTGIAAINAGGVTLHSQFQLPFGAFVPSDRVVLETVINARITTPKSLLKEFRMHSSKRALLRELELLIIDEVSMLRADLLDAIDVVLRHVRRKKNQPFGGLQILFIGDLMQLPPVVKNDEWTYLSGHYSSPFFFDAHALKDNKPLYIELDKIFRQEDERFIGILNNLRQNRALEEDIQTLNRHHKPGFNPEKEKGYVFLTTHNYKADNINNRALKNLPGKTFTYDACIEGDFGEYLYPVDYTLKLKKDAQVMFIKNDYSGEKRYFNGKIGTVTELNNEEIIVGFDDGSDPVEVEPYTWENKRFKLNTSSNEIEENVIGFFKHYPIKLAWAITVHKSQGLTFEKAVIDVSQAFAPGQVYVALSRLTSLDGLILSAPFKRYGPEPDKSLGEFAETKEEPEKLADIYQTESMRYIAGYLRQTFDFKNIVKYLQFFIQSYNKDAGKSVKQEYKTRAEALLKEFLPLQEVGDKFCLQIDRICKTAKADMFPVLKDRTVNARNYFEPLFRSCSQKVNNHIREINSLRGVKKYINELKEVDLLFVSGLQAMYKAEALINAAIENKEPVKEDMPKPGIISAETVPEDNGKTGRKRKRKPEKNTKELSFELFQQGKTISEIAAERSLVETTIEAHLAHFVAQGKIDITHFVDGEKIDPALQAAKALDTQHLKPIKEVLGGEYTYSDLRFIMAHKAAMAKEKKG